MAPPRQHLAHLTSVRATPSGPQDVAPPPPRSGLPDVARLLHLDLSHTRRAMELWSRVIGVGVPDLCRHVVERTLAGGDPGPPGWVLEKTRQPVSGRAHG